jgi:hypothetical protein
MAKIIEDRRVPIAQCLFSVPVMYAEPIGDAEEDDDDDDDGEGEGDAAGEGEGEGDDAGEGEGDDGANEDEEMAEEEDEKKAGKQMAAGRFTLVANSGKPMLNVPGWGTLGIELSGIRAKRRVPALMDHDVSARVGVFDRRKITAQGLVMSGSFLRRSKLARQIDQEMRDGFPMEASVRLQPIAIEEVAEGESAMVNGYELRGPATIFRESELRETSLVTLGQDPNTAVATLSERTPYVTASVTRTETEGRTKVGQPSTAASEAAKAVAEERNRIAKLQAAARPEQATLLAAMIADGTSYADGIAKLHTDLTVRFAALSEQLHQASDQPLSGGRQEPRQDVKATLATLAKLPPSESKHRKQWQLDAELQADFPDEETWLAYAAESVNA